MNTVLRNTRPTVDQLFLDPRTKLLLCLTVSTVMLTMKKTGIFAYIMPSMVILPLVFLIIVKKPLVSLYYGLMYLFCLIVPKYLVPYLPRSINLLFTGIIASMTVVIPGMSMFYFLMKTTTVSEFMAAMEKMHISKILTVPISVLFRFFPTILEEYRSIRDSMKLRGVGSLRNPIEMLEYRLVPLLTALTVIGNDLSISALTRGLDAPNKRSNCCVIGFHIQDIITIILCVALLVLVVIAKIYHI